MKQEVRKLNIVLYVFGTTTVPEHLHHQLSVPTDKKKTAITEDY